PRTRRGAVDQLLRDDRSARVRAWARPSSAPGAGLLRAACLLPRRGCGTGADPRPAADTRHVPRPGRERAPVADHSRLRDAAEPSPQATRRAHERSCSLRRRLVGHPGGRGDVDRTRHHLPVAVSVAAPAILHLSLVTSGELSDSDGRKLGRIEDLVVRLTGEEYPPVSGAVAKVAGRLVFIPAEQIGEIEHGRITVAKTPLDLQPFEPRGAELLLREDLLDRQLINVDGARLVRANEIEIARVEGWWRVVG